MAVKISRLDVPGVFNHGLVRNGKGSLQQVSVIADVGHRDSMYRMLSW
jgi:hypothetical protein